MNSLQLIPAIDLLDGEVVRLYQGDFDQRTRYALDPVDVARRYAAAGARRLHVVDLNAARNDGNDNRGLVREVVAAAGLDVQLGGGVRETTQLEDLFDCGICAAVIGSVAMRDPVTTLEWLKRFGADRIVLALDVRIDAQGTPVLQANGWCSDSAADFWQLLDEYVAVGLQQLLCTDVSRDGSLLGTNIGLYRQIMQRHPGLSVQASGGVGAATHLAELQAAGVSAVIVGKALLDGRIDLIESISRLRELPA